jgi:hypothetical protein
MLPPQPEGQEGPGHFGFKVGLFGGRTWLALRSVLWSVQVHSSLLPFVALDVGNHVLRRDRPLATGWAASLWVFFSPLLVIGGVTRRGAIQ